MHFMIVFAVAFLASLLSSMSGAGAAMLTTPVWLSLGFPLPVAIASNQMNGAAWTLIAARNYLRGRALDWPLIRLMVCFGLGGAYVGTLVMRNVDEQILKRAIGFIIIALVAAVGLNPTLGRTEAEPRLSRRTTGALAFPLGVYESFFGSGNGLFTSFLLSKARGFPLLTALGYYYVIAFFWNCFAVAVYAGAGFADRRLMIPSTAGSMLGAYLGSRVGRRTGYRLVRTLFLALGGVLGLKLALGW
ncbi:sulfite exporter TauE/SafE family protein [Oryzomonas japonica]|uniref:Probable membrane transporter protein n=1 Tax=Oryzomonas japonica TaxID=2603858 RepID=A0A7J4ZQ12_9BACT|nr:sulfite exporter TauE/SafE family protein [Oryzomonas japonica]KAB0665082.1 sulfite exporter TauE/SafE family protein [Oryzomonas japonica]